MLPSPELSSKCRICLQTIKGHIDRNAVLFLTRSSSSLSSATSSSSTSTRSWRRTSTSTSVPLWRTRESERCSSSSSSSSSTLDDARLLRLLRKLTRVLNYYVGHAEEPALTERLYAALKALKYLFRFIVQSRVLYLRYCCCTHTPECRSYGLKMSARDAALALIHRFYGNSEDGDAFFNSIRTLFLSFNTLMDRPLDEGVKIKVRRTKLLRSFTK